MELRICYSRGSCRESYRREPVMRLILGLAVVGVGWLSLSAPAQAQEGLRLRLGRNLPNLHLPLPYHGKTVWARPPEDEHFVFAVEDALDGLGKPKDILVLEAQGLNNGFAMLDRSVGKPLKMLVFDPNWLQAVKDRESWSREVWRANAALALSTLAHEIGHHVCDHLADGRGSLPWKELEADAIAGAILSSSLARIFRERRAIAA